MSTLIAATFLVFAPLPGVGQAQIPAVVEGDAVAGLVSRTAKAEVHLLIDPKLVDHSLVLKIVVLNRTSLPAPFGPNAISVTLPDGALVALIPRATLLARVGAAPAGSRETNNAHETPVLPSLNSAGQQDVTGFSGSMGMTTAGVPQSALERRAPAANTVAAAKFDAVLLKPMAIPAGSADGGQTFTEPLPRGKWKQVLVQIVFAGETHRFRLNVPR